MAFEMVCKEWMGLVPWCSNLRMLVFSMPVSPINGQTFGMSLRFMYKNPTPMGLQSHLCRLPPMTSTPALTKSLMSVGVWAKLCAASTTMVIWG